MLPTKLLFYSDYKKLFLINVVRIELRSNLYYAFFFLQCNIVDRLSVGRRNKLFHLPVDRVVVKLERLDFLYYFDPLFMPCYSSRVQSQVTLLIVTISM